MSSSLREEANSSRDSYSALGHAKGVGSGTSMVEIITERKESRRAKLHEIFYEQMTTERDDWLYIVRCGFILDALRDEGIWVARSFMFVSNLVSNETIMRIWDRCLVEESHERIVNLTKRSAWEAHQLSRIGQIIPEICYQSPMSYLTPGYSYLGLWRRSPSCVRLAVGNVLGAHPNPKAISMIAVMCFPTDLNYYVELKTPVFTHTNASLDLSSRGDFSFCEGFSRRLGILMIKLMLDRRFKGTECQ
jgi:hypothetical protein